jgi:hypothetical protein
MLLARRHDHLEQPRGAGEERREVDRHQVVEEQLSIREGLFTVKHRHARDGWFSSDGVYRFDYHRMDNAAFFVLSLGTLGGFTL